jgi:hypothetical protein
MVSTQPNLFIAHQLLGEMLGTRDVVVICL